MTVNMPQNASLIDTIGDGYRAINRRPLLLLLPLALNLAFWFSAPVTLTPLLQEMQTALATDAAATQAADQQQIGQMFDAIGQTSILPQLSLLSTIPLLTPRPVAAAASVGIGSFGLLAVVFVLINVLILALSAPFLTWLAEAVRGDRATFPVWMRRVAKALGGLAGYLGLLAAGGLVLAIPFLVLASVFLVLAPPLGALLVVVLSIAWFWVGVYVGFAPEAIAISGIGPVRAVQASFQIVRRNFWGTIGLLGLSVIVSSGTGIIWRGMSGSTVGLIIAIIGSTYIGSGLLAARMAFYRERLRRWQASVETRGR